MNQTQYRAASAAAHALLVDALRSTWKLCDQTVELDNGYSCQGGDLSDRLAEALQELARELGSTEALVRHRPGSWEAEHVVRLGYLLPDD